MNRGGGNAASVEDRRIGILAAVEEAAVIEAIGSAAGGECILQKSHELVSGMASGALAAAVITKEVLGDLDMAMVAEALERQPTWSDFPFVLIADRNSLSDDAGLVERLGNVTIVERPIDDVVLGKAVKAALRSRRRQRDAEAYLSQRETAEEHLRQLTETLEARVRERMADLRGANQRLIKEIEEREAAEARLRESEELYRYTVELSQGIIWTSASDGQFEGTTSRYWEVTGMEPGTLPRNAIHPDDRDRVLAEWDHAVATGTPHNTEYRLRLRDGSYRHVRARAAPREDEQGNILRWYGLLENIEQQKRAERAREEAEERYRLAAKATGHAIWDLNLLNNEIAWTASEAALFGYSGAQAATLAWWEERVHPDDRPSVVGSLNDAIQGRRSHWTGSYRFLTAAGEWAHVYDQGYIIRDAGGTAVRAVGAMADVTDLRRSEAETRRVQSELIHVSRLSAMGTMASALAHELNQPLTAISSYLRGSRRLLEQGGASSPERILTAVGAAEEGALRAGQMVRRLRELVSRGSVSARPEELAKLVHDASSIGLVDESLLGVTHRIELDPAAKWVHVDRIQVQQVLINLIRNALQAMEGQERREILISTRASSKTTAEVSVADTGCGIRDGVREALFSPFQTSKAEGMGIGLSISRTIIEAHGGKIWAEDREGGGTIFRFTLPMAEEPVPPVEGAGG